MLLCKRSSYLETVWKLFIRGPLCRSMTQKYCNCSYCCKYSTLHS